MHFSIVSLSFFPVITILTDGNAFCCNDVAVLSISPVMKISQ
jgi:hypothetical protein